MGNKRVDRQNTDDKYCNIERSFDNLLAYHCSSTISTKTSIRLSQVVKTYTFAPPVVSADSSEHVPLTAAIRHFTEGCQLLKGMRPEKIASTSLRNIRANPTLPRCSARSGSTKE